MRIIALEEAFLHPALRELYPASDLKSLDVLKGQLFDVGPERIRRMDAAKNSSPSANTLVRRSATGPSFVRAFSTGFPISGWAGELA